MSRDFGLVKSSLWGSSRFRRLKSDTARLSYVYLHSNEHGSAIGAYRLPKQYLAADMACSQDHVDEIIVDLEGVGLIDYDHGESVVRIRKWFEHNPITNPKHLIGSVRSLMRLPSMTAFLPSLTADIIVSAWEQYRALMAAGHERMRSQNVKSREFGEKNVESATQMAEQMAVLRDFAFRVGRDTFTEAIAALPERLSIPLSEGLSIPLSIHKRQETRNSNSNSYKRQETQTDSPTDTESAPKPALEMAEEFIAKSRRAK
jgi:hypothetical protein